MGVRLPSGALPYVSVSQLTPPARVSPSPPIAPGSGQGEEQLLHVLLVESRVGAGQALLEARGDDREAGPVQGLGHRGELGDDVPAVAALLDHAHHRAELSLGPLEAVDRGCQFVGVELHGELLEEVRGHLPLYPWACVTRRPRALPAGCRAYPRGHTANTPLGMYVRGTPTSGRPDHQGGPMLLERIYDEDLAQAGYFIGCQAENEAMVVDARRDVREYLDLAARHGLSITSVVRS